jgi:hypothetical protein
MASRFVQELEVAPVVSCEAFVRQSGHFHERLYATSKAVCKSIRGPIMQPMKYWEIIADNLNKAGFSWGCVSAIDSNGRTIWVADAHRDDGKRFIVHADDILTAFLELESAIHEFAVDAML